MSDERTVGHPEHRYLVSGSENLHQALELAVAISSSRIGIEHTGRQNRALFLFAKMIAHCMTIGRTTSPALSDPGDAFLDHFSVAALGRAALDSAVMTMYVSEPSLNLTEWNLRRHVLYLHDHSNRKRFLTALERDGASRDEAFVASYEPEKVRLRSKVAEHAGELDLGAPQIERLATGQEVFVNGARGAVREAGWSVPHYDFVQSYWSAHVHGHPVSYMRADEHRISFDAPSAFQLGFVAMVLESVAGYVESVADRMESFTGSIHKDPLGQVD